MGHKFFRCDICGNMVGILSSSGVPLVCCGQEMTELEGNTTDAALEKHVPVVKIEGNRVVVDVGAAPHPMLPEHYIEWVYIKTEKGGQRKELKPGSEAKAVFLIADDDKVETAYAYCNIHSLWKTEVFVL